jgi:predicted ATP-grasp superfamily ATP-dependent carboligase
MTRKLEELFDLSPTDSDINTLVPTVLENQEQLQALDDAIDKVEAALPQVRGLESSDQEMDELASLAVTSYKDLTDLGMQVDSRFASEIFNVASNMLGHAITAKTAKLDKKLKMIDLQMKKMRLDQQQQALDAKISEGAGATETAQGQVLNRNDLLERLLKGKDQNNGKV